MRTSFVSSVETVRKIQNLPRCIGGNHKEICLLLIASQYGGLERHWTTTTTTSLPSIVALLAGAAFDSQSTANCSATYSFPNNCIQVVYWPKSGRQSSIATVYWISSNEDCWSDERAHHWWSISRGNEDMSTSSVWLTRLVAPIVYMRIPACATALASATVDSVDSLDLSSVINTATFGTSDRSPCRCNKHCYHDNCKQQHTQLNTNTIKIYTASYKNVEHRRKRRQLYACLRSIQIRVWF